MTAPSPSLVAPDDLELARACVAGDRGAQRRLFEREKRRVHATLYRIFGSNTHIDDLVQEAFIAVFRSLAGYRGEASLRTWIDRCVVRTAYAAFGKKKLRTGHLELVAHVAADDPSAEHRLAMRDAIRRLYAELDRLDDKQRLAFTLHAIDGRPLEEVARLMEATVVATKARVWRARGALEKRAQRDPLLAEFLSGARPAQMEEDGAS